METLQRLIDDFTRYRDDLSAAQANKDKLGFKISSMDGHIEKLKVLEKALSEQKEMGSAARKTEESI